MTNQTPGEDQAQVNSVSWTNGKGLVTGATIMALLTAIIGTFYLYGPLSGTNVWTGTNAFNGAITFGDPSSARANLGAAAAGANSDITSNGAAVFYAKAFGSCTWDAAHDIGACINLAIAAAAAHPGGGEVVVPGGQYGQSVTIANSTTGVSIRGAGIGDIAAGSAYQYGTELDWIGAPDGTMLDVEPAGAYSLKGVNVRGIVFNAENLADYAVKGAQFTNSAWQVAGINARVDNVWLTAQNGGVTPGTQDNDFWLYAYSDSATYKPTGILFDGQGASFNVSVNRIHELLVYYNLGDGVVSGFADNNIFDGVRTFPINASTSTGNPLVLAAKGYVTPNGQQVAGANATNGNLFLHDSAKSTWIQGLTGAATIVPGGGNACTNCGPTTVPLTTNATSNPNSYVLNFAATTGVVVGENIGCGGTSSGVQTGSPIAGITSSTLTLGNSTLAHGVSSGQACTVSFGAVTPTATYGAYTVTATGASTVSISGPNSYVETGLSTAGGTLTSKVLIAPWAPGSMTAGDAWTFNLSKPAFANIIMNIDTTNAAPVPTIGAGASGGYSWNNQGVIQPFGAFSKLTVITAAQSPYAYNPYPGQNPTTVFLLGAGGGGGGGPRQTAGALCSGGGGGGAGSGSIATYAAAQIGGSTTINVGSGGAAGAPAASDSTVGGDGGNGSLTSFGGAGLQAAYGGCGGAGGGLNRNSGGGGGAGLVGACAAGVTNTGGAAGLGGTAGGSSGNSTALSSYSGGGTGGAGAVNGGLGAGSGNNIFGSTGGGGGGGVDASNVAYAGGNAGYAPAGPYANALGGAAGANGAPGATPLYSIGFAGPGGGGGGGASTGTAGSGGAGGNGGGGGGGGCARNGQIAGSGGKGGDGLAIVIQQ